MKSRPEVHPGAQSDRVRWAGGRAIPTRLGQFWEPIATVLLSSGIFILGFGGGPGRLSLPLGGGDLLQAYNAGRMWGDGDPFGNAAMGFPFGMELRYYPTADLAQNGLAGLVGNATGNMFFGMNFVFAASFPVAAVCALWVLKLVQFRGPIAVFTAVAFTVIPFHWLRIEHVYLATIYSLVLGLGLAFMVGSGDFERRLRRWRTPRALVLPLALLVIIGVSSIYYAFFTAMLCTVAIAYRWLNGAAWRAVLRDCVSVVGVVLVTALALAPAFLFERSNPALEAVAGREPVESVLYSGVLALALMPNPVSMIPGFGPLNDFVAGAYASGQIVPTAGVFLSSNAGSFFTTAALLFAIGGYAVWRRRRASTPVVGSAPDRQRDDESPAVNMDLVMWLTLVSLLFFIPWGLNYLFSYAVSAQIRGWDRLLPVIFLLVFVAASLVWQRLRLAMHGYRAWSVAGVCGVLLILDSVLPYRAYFDQAAAFGTSRLVAGNAYASALNAAVPGDCGVLQLPYIGYPEEPPVVSMGTYDHYWPALTNTEKRWSYAAMKNTLSSAWQANMGNDIDAETIGYLGAEGFCAIHVNREGYADADADLLTGRLTELLGQPVATGDDGNWVAFAVDSRGVDAEDAPLAVSDMSDEMQVFYMPPSVVLNGSVSAELESDAFREWWWLDSEEATFEIRSIDPMADFASVSGEILAAECSGTSVIVRFTSEGVSESLVIDLSAGESKEFTLSLDQPVTEAALSVDALGEGCVRDGGSQRLAVAVINPSAGF